MKQHNDNTTKTEEIDAFSSNYFDIIYYYQCIIGPKSHPCKYPYSMYHTFLIHNQYIYLRTFQPPLPLGYPCSSIPKQNEMSEDTHCHENIVCNSEETKRYSNINGLCNNVDVPPQGAVGTDFWHLLDKRKNNLYIIVTECKWPIAIAIFLLLKLSKYVVFLCNQICCKEEVYKYFSNLENTFFEMSKCLYLSPILLPNCRYFESHQI